MVNGTIKSQDKYRVARNIGIFSTLLFLVTMVSGCYQHHEKDVKWIPISNEDRHPIHIRKNVIDIELDVHQGANGLTNAQKNNLRHFLKHYLKQGNSKLHVSSPREGVNETSVFNVIGDIKRQFEKYNIAPGYVAFKSYRASDNTLPSIKIAYGRYTAHTAKCGDWSENLSNNPQNLNYPNFGCAQQQNLAAMIENPGDLLGPRRTTPRSSERRDVVWDKYVKGETTVSDRDSQEKGTVSDVAKE